MKKTKNHIKFVRLTRFDNNTVYNALYLLYRYGLDDL